MEYAALSKTLPKRMDFGTLTFDDREYEFVRRSGYFLLRSRENEHRGINIFLTRKEADGHYDWLPREIRHYRTNSKRKLCRIGPFMSGLYVDRTTADALSAAVSKY